MSKAEKWIKRIKKWYYYENGVERIPIWIRRFISILRGDKGFCYIVRDGEWARKCSDKYNDRVKINERNITSSNIKCSHNNMARFTEKINIFLDERVNTHYYRWGNMLLINDVYGQSPLTSILIFWTKEKLKVCYEVVGKKENASYCNESSLCNNHKVAIYGLYAGTDNIVRIKLVDEQGNIFKEGSIVISTKALPKKLVNIIKVNKQSDSTALAFILISGGRNIKTLAFDQNGEVRFYLKHRAKSYGIFPIQNGRFLYTVRNISIPSYFVPQGAMYYDMNYLGGVNRTYFTPKGIHHNACPMGRDYVLMCSSSFFGSVENAVAQVELATGKIIKMLVLDDLFDEHYRNWKDWAHVNSVYYVEDENSVIISMRNVHSVIKVDWETMKLEWILANPEFWNNTDMKKYVLTPKGDIKWFYQQHAAGLLSCGEFGKKRVILYDNHWAKRRKTDCFDGDETYSYATTFIIDEVNNTVCMEKTHAFPKSTIRGNTLFMEEENRLFQMSGNLLSPIENCGGMIEEMDYENGERKNIYLIKQEFFTAYGFEADGAEMEKTTYEKGNLIVGDTVYLEKIEELPEEYKNPVLCIMSKGKVKIKSDTAKEVKRVCLNMPDIHFYCDEDVLYARSYDHVLSEICIASGGNIYKVSFTKGLEDKKLIYETTYAIPISLKKIEDGKYSLFFKTQNGTYIIEDCFDIY